MKYALPVVGCRILLGLNEKLNAYMQESGEPRSQVMRDALSAHLGVNTSAARSSDG